MEPGQPRSRAPAPAAALVTVWLELRPRTRGTDQVGLFEESRIALVFAPELANETRGIDLLVASLSMTFHKELRAPGLVRVGASVSRIGSSSLDIRQAIFAGEICHASAEAVCVLFGSVSRRPVQVSSALRTAFGQVADTTDTCAGLAKELVQPTAFHHGGGEYDNE